MRYSLSTVNINKIDLGVANIEVHFHYYLFFCIGQEHFNAIKVVLYMKKPVIG